MAGIPYDVISEEDLLDLNIIRQYDALVLPHFKNVNDNVRAQIRSNLDQVVKNEGIGILASGPFMQYNQNENFVGDADMQSILNVLNAGSSVSGNVDVIVADANHPTARRFSQNEVYFSLNGFFC